LTPRWLLRLATLELGELELTLLGLEIITKVGGPGIGLFQLYSTGGQPIIGANQLGINLFEIVECSLEFALLLLVIFIAGFIKGLVCQVSFV
jgi:hypothetical protein